VSVDTAMVLAAGLGTRLRPLTDTRPKALVTVNGKALIDYTLDRLAASGVSRAVVNVHHFADLMEAHLRAREGGPEIIISDERDGALETGGGVVRARPYLGEGPVLVCNIDAVFLPDSADETGFDPLVSGFDPDREDVRLYLVPKHRASGLETAGDFHCDADGRLRRRAPDGQAPYYYAGAHVTRLDIFDGWPEAPFSLNKVWDQALESGRLRGAVFQGDWLHVGDPRGHRAAEARLGGS